MEQPKEQKEIRQEVSEKKKYQKINNSEKRGDTPMGWGLNQILEFEG